MYGRKLRFNRATSPQPEGKKMNHTIIGYNIKFTNYKSIGDDYNFITLEDATNFVDRFQKYGYKAEITTIIAMRSMNTAAI
jgi:hypothetical protein